MSPQAAMSVHTSREIVHDFNNLLTAIIGAAEAVLERSQIDPETREDLAHIREGARRGGALVQRLRAAVSVPPGLISVCETIQSTSRLLMHRLGAGIALTLDLVGDGGAVRLETSQLDRIILNLITNAGHAMPNGGAVTLATGRRVVAVAESRVPDTIPPGDFVVISVADSGHGIAPDRLSRIFEPEFSAWRHGNGTGLGLSSVRDMVRLADGFITVESRPGHGARFEIYLPREERGAQKIKAARPLAVGGTVLLVEDDPLVRQIAERVLRRAGWLVHCADSAEAALDILDRSLCDLMISDVALPGMDGLALARRARTGQPAMPIILTSGYEHTLADDDFETGDLAYLAKPYSQEDLLEALDRAMADDVPRRPPRG